nr:MAG TPA: hypothetical protein [Caudoviricetes sp.]
MCSQSRYFLLNYLILIAYEMFSELNTFNKRNMFYKLYIFIKKNIIDV